MISNDEFKAIAALDLDPIKVKLMHRESGEGWSLAKANAMEIEYRRFLFLMKKFPHEQTAPLVDVDTFWHYHILDTMKYAVDCEAVFGHFLHHFPYIGMRGEDDVELHQRSAARMQELYESTFGVAYLRAAPATGEADRAYCGMANASAYCGIANASADRGTATPTSAYRMMDAPAASAAPTAVAAYCGIAATGASPASYYSKAIQASYFNIAAKAAYCGITANAAGEHSRFNAQRPTLAMAA